MVAAFVWLLSVAVIGAQGARDERPRMAEEVFKNVQILKGIPVDQFMGTMGFFSASLGLNCTDCHTDKSGGDWARYADENPRKQTARRMMQMVSSVNQMYFGGKGNYKAYDDAEKSPFEMYARGPGQRTIAAHPPSGDTTWTLNGNSAWVAAPATDKPVPVLAITGPELDGVKLESEVFFPARIKQSLTNDRRIAVREANTI